MMRNTASLFIALSCLAPLFAEDTESVEQPQPVPSAIVSKQETPKVVPITSFEPFTGKITKNKVRLRLQPSYDGPVLKEFNRNQLVIVTGESDDFYAIQPLPDMKAYIFRTYVLDNVVEGTRVNVRLQPDLDAPVIAQLNSGDRVDGEIYTSNTKWLQIAVPQSTRFFIAKEYIEKIGDAGYLVRMEKRRDEVYQLLNSTKVNSEAEMQKPFEHIHLDGTIANYRRIILDYKDFPEASTKAEEWLKTLQEAYTAKRIAYLEQQAQQSSQQFEQKNKELIEELNTHKKKLSELELQMQQEKEIAATSYPITEVPPSKVPAQLPYNMAAWVPVEEGLFKTWSTQTGNDSPLAFYQDQREQAFLLKGVVDTYNRPVKNKPGDYMLLSVGSKLPIAYLYSTQINLQDYVGHEVALWVVPRQNFNYAFPAYFVLSLE